MADYNMGRATGEIQITADTRGAAEASAAMASTAAEAAALDAAMGRVNKTFDENRNKTLSSAEALVQARGEVEQLRRVYQRQQEDYIRGQRRVDDAKAHAHNIAADEESDINAIRQAHNALNRAQDEANRLRQRAAQSLEEYHNKVAAVRQEVDLFNRAHLNAVGGMRGMRREAEQLGDALERMSSMLGTIARTVGTGGLMAMFGLASGGQLVTSGAAGLNGLTTLLAGALEIIKDLSGALLLLPGIISAGVISLGTLAVAFHGVGQAISAMGDPAKFLEAIKDMGPITQQAMMYLQSFTEAFRGARQVVQESFFAQIVNDIQPLVRTWLPLLMNTGREVAGQFGQMFHQAFAVFQEPAIIRGFQLFVQNMSAGMQAARGAIRPFIEAWSTLSVVGSAAFQRLGVALTDVVNKFNNWVQRSAESGKLTAWIDRALTAFTNIGHVVVNLATAINNIFNIARGDSGTFLNNLVRITAEFRAWTESVKGQNAIANFFELLSAAATVVRPEMKLLGEALSIVGGALTRLGIALGPGITALFTSLRDSLATLAPIVISLAPSLNQFLTVLGDTLLKVVQQIGPQLPRVFQGLADALIALAPVLPGVAQGIATILEHLTPGEIQGIFLAVIALKALSVAFAGLLAVMSINPVVLVIAALAALALGVIYAYNHFKGFHELVNNLWPTMQRFASWIRTSFVNAWHSLGETISKVVQGAKDTKNQIEQAMVDAVNGIGNFFQTVWDDAYNWGHNLVSKIVEGMKDMLGPVGRIAVQIMEVIKDPIPGSRARIGPFADASPEEMGAKLASDFAGGIASGSPGASAASLSLATGAAGGGVGGASIGAPGGSGPRTFDQGKSGFDQAVSFLTKDLSAWSSIIENAFNLFKDIGQIFIDTVKVTASLWNRGDNPLTRPGGIAGPPIAAAQQAVPGVPSKPIRGVAPLPELVPGGPAADQQNVPGVPNKPIPGAGGGVPPANPPASTTGQAPPASLPNVSGTAGTGTFSIPPTAGAPAAPAGAPPAGAQNYTGQDAELAGALKAQGFTDSQITGLVALNKVETGDWSHPESIMGFTNQQTGPGIGPHVAGFKEMWGRRQSSGAVVAAGHPDSGLDANGTVVDPGKYANWLLKLEGYSATSDWQGNQYPTGQFMPAETYAGKVAGAYDGVPKGMPGTPSSVAPPVRGVPYGLPTGTNTGGYGNPAANQIFPQWVLDLGAKFNVKPSTYPEHQESDRGGEAGYAPNPQNQNRGIDWVGSPADMEKFAQALIAYGGAEGSGGALEQVIYQAGPGGTRYGLGGAGNVNNIPNEQGGYYPQSGEGSYDEHGGAGNAHVHTRFGASVAPDLGLTPPAPPAQQAGNIQVPGLPRGPGGITPGGLELPSDGATAAIGAGAAVAGGAYVISRLARMGSNARIKWLQYNYNRLDRLAKNDVLKSLSAEERALIGKNPEIAFGPEGVKAPEVRALIVDLGGSPDAAAARAPSLFSQLGLGDQREFAGAIQEAMQRPGGIRGGPSAEPSLVDVYHITDEAGARGIMEGGFQGGGGRQAYFNTDPRNARASLGIYGDRVIAGQVPQSALENIGAAVRANPADLQGVNWRELNPAQLEDISRTNIFSNPDTGTPPARPPASTTGSAAPSIAGDVARGGLGSRVVGALGRYAPLIGPGISEDVKFTDAQGNPIGPTTRQQTISDVKALATPVLPQALLSGSTITGQESTQTPGVVYGPNGQVISAGPRAPSIFGGPGAQADRRGSTPVHVTNAQELPGGTQSPGIKPASAEGPLKPGDKGFIGPVAVQPRDQGPRPGAQRERRGAQDTPTLGDAAASDLVQGQIGQGSDNAKTSTKSPIDQFQDTLSSVGSIAGDAFQIFNDIIRNIGAAANITDLLVRGFANTEDVMFYIDEMQTFITTAADIAKLVGDVGGMVGGASGGADFGAGAAIQAIAGIVSSALEATNAAIDLGQEVYHEVTKYAGFIIGSFLGGPGTGPLGGNVRMLLNTSTNQLYTYSEDNPQNKNTFEVPAWQRSYQQTPPPTTVQQQTNIYAGPGQTPRDMMNETMWLVGTGNASVASVSGYD